MTKKIEQEQALELRRNGESIKVIAKMLNVSPGSVSRWTKDIKLSEKQKEILESRHGGRAFLVREATSKKLSERAREKRRRYQQEGRKMAQLITAPLFIGGCMLYWAEGSKNKNECTMTNSNPHMLKYFQAFLSEYFGVTPAQYTMNVTCYLNNGLSLEEIEGWWLGQLGLSHENLRKAVVKTGTTNRKRRLVYGTCRLRIKKSTKILQTIYGAIQEIGGFDQPRWLG